MGGRSWPPHRDESHGSIDAMHPLIDVAELRAVHRDPAPPTLLDVRWRPGGPPGIERFRAGHLPGARYADLDRDLAAPPGSGGRHPLPDPASFQAAMRRLGVRGDRPVVVYDDGDATVAARLWWLLTYHGHPAVRVLDGGYRAWAESGGPIATGDESDPGDGDFVARPGGLPLVEVAEVPNAARNGVLLDARAAARYRGEVEPLDPVAGHIPGAISAPTTDNVTDDGRFRPVDELRERFLSLGVRADRPITSYCGSGVTAAHQVLALRLAGFTAALYAGSWSEWITDPSRPVARGPRPDGSDLANVSEPGE